MQEDHKLIWSMTTKMSWSLRVSIWLSHNMGFQCYTEMLMCSYMLKCSRNFITHFFLSSWCSFALFYFLPFCIGSRASLSATLFLVLRLWFLLVAKEGIATTVLHPWPSEEQATPLICGILCVSPCSSTPHCRAWQVQGEGEDAVPAKHTVKLTVSSRMCRWLLEEIPCIAGIGDIF